jgi:hypothetical protein
MELVSGRLLFPNVKMKKEQNGERTKERNLLGKKELKEENARKKA